METVTEMEKTKKPTPLQSIRKKCLWCCLNCSTEVKLCPATGCPLHVYRFGRGHSSKEQPLTVSKAIKQKCLDCSAGNRAEVRGCDREDTCVLWPHRQGCKRKCIGATTVPASMPC